MADKLTLKLGVKITSPTNNTKVEVIKKRRILSPVSDASNSLDTKINEIKADKLKNILENAQKELQESKNKAEQEAKLEQKRQYLIETTKEKIDNEIISNDSVAPVNSEIKNSSNKKYKKNKDDDFDDWQTDYKTNKKIKDNKKISFENVVISRSDLDDYDDEEQTISNSLNSAIDVIGTHQHRRSFASIKRQKEKNYRKFMEKQGQKEVQKTYHEVILPETISVKELSIRMAEKSSDVIKVMMKMGIMATVNQIIDADTAELIIMEMGHSVKRVSDSDNILSILQDNNKEEKLEPRAPVITVMGHVDHGKTSLLDAFRKTDVVSKEAGGITQHIGAYQITTKIGKKITFIDTPGHEAFSAMRARGVNATDIVILVVAANDGIMPQTIEAINHAKVANVPIIVAINKIDLPEANPEKVRMELLQHGLVVEKLGGQILDVEISAKNKTNLDKLEELLLLQADMMELKGNIAGSASGIVIEAKMEQGKGSTATILIQKGILKKGDIFISGSAMGKVRELLDEFGNKVNSSIPSQPVVVLGFENTPTSGDDFVVVETEAKAREVVEYRKRKEQEKRMVIKKSNWQEVFKNIKEGKVETLPVIIKGDTQGSIEAIKDSLIKIKSDKVKVDIIHVAVGAVSESDIVLAKTTNSIIIAFNVRASSNAKDEAKTAGIDIRYYSVIYNIIDDIKILMSGLLAPIIKEHFIGYADVLQVFNIGKAKAAGCKVTEGTIKKGAGVRILRDNIVIFEGKLAQLKRIKDDVKEVHSGTECGISFDNFNDLQINDKLECFEIEEIKADL